MLLNSIKSGFGKTKEFLRFLKIFVSDVVSLKLAGCGVLVIRFVGFDYLFNGIGVP